MSRSDHGKTTRGIGRREFLLKALVSGGLAARYLGSPVSFLVAKNTFDQVPQTATPIRNTKELVTPNIDFFIRDHFATPRINDDAWRLEISGLVSKPLKLSYSDLVLMPSVRHTSTLECAGNASGGAGVATAVWSGLPLADLLHQSGPNPAPIPILFHRTHFRPPPTLP